LNPGPGLLGALAHASLGYAQKNDRRRPRASLAAVLDTSPAFGRPRSDGRFQKRDGLVDELKKALSERILKQRLASIWMASIEGMSNHRNGYS